MLRLRINPFSSFLSQKRDLLSWVSYNQEIGQNPPETQGFLSLPGAAEVEILVAASAACASGLWAADVEWDTLVLNSHG